DGRIMRVRPFLLLAIAIAIDGCSSDPPVAMLTVSPDHGIAPERIRFDASGSTPGVVVRFDFEWDGVFDTEYSTALPVEHEYTSPGQFHAYVEVKDAEGKIGSATKEIDIAMNQPPSPVLNMTPGDG